MAQDPDSKDQKKDAGNTVAGIPSPQAGRTVGSASPGCWGPLSGQVPQTQVTKTCPTEWENCISDPTENMRRRKTHCDCEGLDNEPPGFLCAGWAFPWAGSAAALNIYHRPLRAGHPGQPEMAFFSKELTAWMRMEFDSDCAQAVGSLSSERCGGRARKARGGLNCAFQPWPGASLAILQ